MVWRGSVFLVLALGLSSVAAPAEVAEARVAAYARACFAKAAERQWTALLACFDATDLADLHGRYVQRFRPAYVSIPPELQVAFGIGVERTALLAMPPAELLGGAIEGALAGAGRGDDPQPAVELLVRSVEHAVDDVYTVQLRAVLRTWRDHQSRRQARDYVLKATLAPHRITLQVPAFLYDLLDAPPAEQDRGASAPGDERG